MVSRKNASSVINYIVDTYKIDLLLQTYRRMGIHLGSGQRGGEQYFIEQILPSLLKTKPRVLFDVGGNVGNYTQTLNKAFPEARVFSFEPIKSNYEQLESMVNTLDNISCFNIGMSSVSGTKKIYFPNSKNNVHGSLYEGSLKELLNYEELYSEEIELTTLDDFTKSSNIDQIDFLKIDTEGHELEVLEGAKNLIDNQKIKVIQFEFNEMNIMSRTFLIDFYKMLTGFDFYRLRSQDILPLGAYNSRNEIFQIQNLIAVRKGL